MKADNAVTQGSTEPTIHVHGMLSLLPSTA